MIKALVYSVVILFGGQTGASAPTNTLELTASATPPFSGLDDAVYIDAGEGRQVYGFPDKRDIYMAVPNLVAVNAWGYTPEIKIMLFPPVTGREELDREVQLFGVFWLFMPFILPETGGTIDRIIVTGQNNNGKGSKVDIGYGIWNAAQPTGNDNYGKLGTLLYSGTTTVNDNAIGQEILVSGMNIVADQQQIWVGIACDFGQGWNIQGAQSVAFPGLNGVSGNQPHPGVYGIKLQFGHASPPAEGSVITLGGAPFSIYISWTKP